MSSDEVIAGARRGDPWALDAVYRTYSPQVLGYLRGLRVPDPEGVTGDVFVSVVRNVANFVGGETEFPRWLFTIAHRRAVDAFRRGSRQCESAGGPLSLGEDVEARDDVAEQVATHVTLAPLVAALDSLTTDQRAVMLLRVIADLSVEETAAILGKNAGAVKTLQRRAISSLQRALSLQAVS
jgi:RNA polymerase sigma-70 factor (ECF subfamily)